MTIGLVALAAVAALVALEVASGGGGGEKRRAPQLPTEVLHPPKVTLGELHGRPALVNFFASWCGPCREEAPEVEALARSLRGRAALVGVDWSDDLGNARDFVHEHGWTFPVLRDHGEVGDEYGISGLPATFVLDSKGMIVNTLRGPQTRGDLEEALRSVESEEESEPAGDGA